MYGSVLGKHQDRGVLILFSHERGIHDGADKFSARWRVHTEDSYDF